MKLIPILLFLSIIYSCTTYTNQSNDFSSNEQESIVESNQNDQDYYLPVTSSLNYTFIDNQWYRIILSTPPIVQKVESVNILVDNDGYAHFQTSDGPRYIYIRNMQYELDNVVKSIAPEDRLHSETGVYSIESLHENKLLIDKSTPDIMKLLVSDSTGTFINKNLVPLKIPNKNIILKINLDYDSNSFSILSGYVDIENRMLFKNYSRLKRIKIISADRSEEIVFNDLVELKNIKFDHYEAFQNIDGRPYILLEILEVYNGTEMQEICISAIYVNEPIMPDSVEDEYYISEMKRIVSEF